MTANIITVSRILFSVLLLVFSPYSYFFAALYLLCGITDVLDGFVARRLHTESEQGAMLDSVADLLFAVIYAVRILPLLSVCVADVKCGATLVCAVATVTVIKEIVKKEGSCR